MAFYGVDTNLVTYLMEELNKSNAVATTISTTWVGTCNVTPLIGAITTDACLGRYRTMDLTFIFYFIGLTTLTLLLEQINTIIAIQKKGDGRVHSSIGSSLSVILGLCFPALVWCGWKKWKYWFEWCPYIHQHTPRHTPCSWNKARHGHSHWFPFQYTCCFIVHVQQCNLHALGCNIWF